MLKFLLRYVFLKYVYHVGMCYSSISAVVHYSIW